MVSKKILYSIFIVLISFGFSYAGELLYEEGVNHYNAGVKAQKRGDFKQAMADYQKALLLMGSTERNYNKFVFNNIGVMYASLGDLEDAETAFLEAVRIDPNYKQANFNLGILYVKEGNSKEAFKYWERLSGGPEIFILEEERQLGEVEEK
jgi:tetratricopeptide (TPR) repeat protein